MSSRCGVDLTPIKVGPNRGHDIGAARTGVAPPDGVSRPSGIVAPDQVCIPARRVVLERNGKIEVRHFMSIGDQRCVLLGGVSGRVAETPFDRIRRKLSVSVNGMQYLVQRQVCAAAFDPVFCGGRNTLTSSDRAISPVASVEPSSQGAGVADGQASRAHDPPMAGGVRSSSRAPCRGTHRRFNVRGPNCSR